MPEAALSIRDLRVTFSQPTGKVQAVDGISLDVAPGEVLGLVGESGSGKSVTGLACLGLLPTEAEVSGRVVVGGVDMTSADDRTRIAARGRQIAMVFQDALAALNPYKTVGRQIADAYRLRNNVSRREGLERAQEMLAKVGMRDPARQVHMYPHEFSGGMRQRAMIAMATVNAPAVLIADEPTTALDVTVQAQVLDLLIELVSLHNMALVLITHDMGVVAETADQVAVMYAGRVVENAPVRQLFESPSHPYTAGLLASTPRLDGPVGRLPTLPGSPASGADLPAGCAFHPRCWRATQMGSRCLEATPVLQETASGQFAACHAVDSLVTARRTDD